MMRLEDMVVGKFYVFHEAPEMGSSKWNERPGWTHSMAKMAGQPLEVRSIGTTTVGMVQGFSWKPEWLEPFDKEEAKALREEREKSLKKCCRTIWGCVICMPWKTRKKT